MARTYKRDSKGRFAGGGGGSKDARGPAKVGRSGPRGGKVGSKTEQKRAAQAQAARSAQFRSKTQSSGAKAAYKAAGRGARMTERNAAAAVARKPANPARKVEVVDAQVMNPSRQPGRGSMTATLRGALRELAQSDARFIREIESITGQKIKRPANTSKPQPALGGSGTRTGKVSDALRANLRQLAQSDARRMREMAEILAPPKLSGSTGGSRRRVSGSTSKPKALPSSTSRKRKK